MNYYGVRVPAEQTLAKYGLSMVEWKRMARAQKGKCAICGRSDVRLVIDHEHIAGWKYMGPEERKKYVRGLICDRENHWILSRYATVWLLEEAAKYLRRYEERRDEHTGG